MIDRKKIQIFRDQIFKGFHPEKIILFGSYAYGGPGSDSDVDMLVIMHFDAKGAHQAAKIMTKVRPNFPVDMLVRTPEQITDRVEKGDFFIKEILEHGEVLYETDYA